MGIAVLAGSELTFCIWHEDVKLTGVYTQKQFEKDRKILVVNVVACMGCFKLLLEQTHHFSSVPKLSFGFCFVYMFIHLNDPCLWYEDPLSIDRWQDEASGDSY